MGTFAPYLWVKTSPPATLHGGTTQQNNKLASILLQDKLWPRISFCSSPCVVFSLKETPCRKCHPAIKKKKEYFPPYKTKEGKKEKKSKLTVFTFTSKLKPSTTQKFGSGVLSARALLPPAGQQSFHTGEPWELPRHIMWSRCGFFFLPGLV